MFAKGSTVDDNDLIRLSNVAAPLLTALDLDKRRPPTSESLDPREYAPPVIENWDVDCRLAGHSSFQGLGHPCRLKAARIPAKISDDFPSSYGHNNFTIG